MCHLPQPLPLAFALVPALVLVLVLGVGGTAEADPKVDLAALMKKPAALEKHLTECSAKQAKEDFPGTDRPIVATLGGIERAEPLAGRPVTEQMHVIGKKARAYVRFQAEGSCDIVPVVGKPAGFARGNFGRGAKNAYVLRQPDCDKFYCPTAVSLKTEDDKLVDVLFIDDGCYEQVTADKLALFNTHDSLRLSCWGAAGADRHRNDYLLDAGDKPLKVVFQNFAGVAWIQLGSSPNPDRLCAARPPYEILVTTTGASPVLTVSRKPTDEEYERVKDKVEWRSGGCDATALWLRHTYDAAKRTFVPSGAPRFAIVDKLCNCRK